MINCYKKNAFSLLEMSFTILIIGILLIGGINFLAFLNESSRNNTTNKKIESLQKALGEYILVNNRLPCPSDLSISKTNSNYGKEKRSASTYKCETAETSGYFSNNNILYGGIPTKDLQLTDDYSLDGWGNQITYTVDRRFTIYYDNSTNEGFFTSGGESIIIKNIKSTEEENNSNTATDKAIYVLISSGKNAKGSFRDGNNTWNIDDISPSEEQNTYISGNLNNIFIKDSPSSNFDDLVHYEGKNDIILRLDLGDVQCTLNDLNSIPKKFEKPSNALLLNKCKNELCEQGVEIQSSSNCATLNDGESIIINSKNKPVRKCLKYGQWSDILYPCIKGCELNIGAINSNANVKNGIVENQDILDKLGRIEATSTDRIVTLYCNALNTIGYVTLSCNNIDNNWKYDSGFCIKTSCSSTSFNMPSNCTLQSVPDVEVTSGSNFICNCNNNLSSVNITCTDGFWIYSDSCSGYCENNILNSNPNHFIFSIITGTSIEDTIHNGSCDTGYEIIYNGTTPLATCQNNGTWLFSGGPCELPCSNSLLNFSYATFTNITGTTANGTQLNGTCLGNVSQTITATCNSGTWSFSAGSCPVVCLNNILNTSYTIANSTFSPATSITYSGQYLNASCNAGYSLIYGGNAVTGTCESNGIWSFSGGPCEVPCSNTNMNHSYTEFANTIGTTSSRGTNPGFCLGNTSQTITANCSSGTWSYTGGTCSAVCQNSLLNTNNTIPNSTFSTTTGITNSSLTRTASCNAGYILENPANPITATCGSNGSWTYSGVCVTACNNANIAYNYAQFSSTSGTTGINNTVSGFCSGATGQTITATCQSGGIWGYSGGTCPTVCYNSSLATNTIYTTFSTTTGVTSPAGTVGGHCDSNPNVSVTATCGSNGNWSFSGQQYCGVVCQNSIINSVNTIPNSTFSTITGVTGANSSLDATCNAGYTLAVGASNVSGRCQTNGNWTFIGGPCGRICQNNEINPSLYTGFATTGTTNPGISLYGSCTGGQFRQVIATCQNNGTWSFNIDGGSCPILCNNTILNTNNVHFVFNPLSGYSSSGTVVYAASCETGYSHVNLEGVYYNKIATCGSDGHWIFSGGPCGLNCQNNTINFTLYAGFPTTGMTNSGDKQWGRCTYGAYKQAIATCQLDGTWAYTISGDGICPTS